MTKLSNQVIQATLRPYGFLPDSVQFEAIRTYISLLLRWNQKISLTAVVDPIEILRFHFGESLFAAFSVPIRKGRLADVGSGAGFPGLPLCLAVSGLSVTLIEPNAKKAAFLAEVVRQLNLKQVDVVRQRMDDLPSDLVQFDYITARALGGYKTLLASARGRLAKNGRIVLWLGEAESQSMSADTSWIWHDPIHIPGSKRRFILVGSPVA
jgi:16S rRNA (guanine527-N7)-methyltransferase